jgi:hypothetical protein
MSFGFKLNIKKNKPVTFVAPIIKPESIITPAFIAPLAIRPIAKPIIFTEPRQSSLERLFRNVPSVTFIPSCA